MGYSAILGRGTVIILIVQTGNQSKGRVNSLLQIIVSNRSRIETQANSRSHAQPHLSIKSPQHCVSNTLHSARDGVSAEGMVIIASTIPALTVGTVARWLLYSSVWLLSHALPH